MPTEIAVAQATGLVTKKDPYWVKPVDSFSFSERDKEVLIAETNKSFEVNFLSKYEEESSPAGYIFRYDFLEDIPFEEVVSFVLENRSEFIIPLSRVKQKMEEQFSNPKKIKRCLFITPNIHGVPMLIQSRSRKNGLSLKSYPQKDTEPRFRELTKKEWGSCLRLLGWNDSVLFSFQSE